MGAPQPIVKVDLTVVGTAEIARLSLKPGDVLVVKVVGHTIDHLVGGRIREHFERVVGDRNAVLILDNSMDVSILNAEQAKPLREVKAM